MQRPAGESPKVEIYGGVGGTGGAGGGQGGGGGGGQGPSFGGMQFVIDRLTVDAGLSGRSQAEGASSQLSPSGMGARRIHVVTPSLQATGYSESGNYCGQLLRQGRGFPLYVPGPQLNLSAEYRMKGVAIGDVGRVTSEGCFDFFFNIYLPAGHPINANVPEDFVPLSPYDPIDVTHYDFSPGNYVSSPSVTDESNSDSPEFPGGEFVFSCREPTGAVLTLPHGAHLEKLENLENTSTEREDAD
ncbi:hypothetical protein B0H12DRAFT_702794 [Mycena haematopus]|nr:hypothetical protein B0H12DRAFT_702794 [Mycena haematopus]